MADVYIAIKPKYPTRKAVDKVIFNEGNFLTIIKEKSSRQLLSLLDTSLVSIINNNKYYPVDVNNYEAQYNLVSSGLLPTVPENTSFGVKTLDYFASATTTTGLTNVQDNVQVYNGIIRGTLYRLYDYSKIGIASINKNGYWFVFKYDLTAANTEGYSNIKLFDGTTVVNGDNYVYLGAEDEDVSKYVFAMNATLTVGTQSGAVSVPFATHFNVATMNTADTVPAIVVNDRSFTTLVEAFNALSGKGGTITINRSVTEANTATIDITDGCTYVINFASNVTVSLAHGISVKSGSLYVKGTGTLKETTPNYAPIMLLNTDESKSVYVNIAEGITLTGWAGLFYNKASYNLSATCYGKCVGQNDGTGDGAGVYVNGNVESGNLNFYGSTEGTVGIGIFASGNIHTTLSGAKVYGSCSGLEIRAGTLSVLNGSRIESSSTEEPTMVPSGNGSTSTACGLAIAQHTTKKQINVVVDDSCVLIGKAALMEGNPQQNPTATTDTTIKVNGGSFVGAIKTLTPASDCTKFLYGGIYNAKPDDSFVADGYKSQLMSNGRYEIVKA